MKKDFLNDVLEAQRNEITEFFVYSKLAKLTKNDKNAKVLDSIARDEKKHYGILKSISNVDVKPYKWKIFKFYWIARIFGLTFGIKLMEGGEENAQVKYGNMIEFAPQIRELIDDEAHHEKELIEMIDEEKLNYIGSIVLGLNDALVELTGALAGFTGFV